ncbi:MAG: YciI family protein [Rhodoferax sp.]|nr:YciI family protein [Rhodoferax sp.]
MRFMIIVKATPDSEAGVMPPDTLLAEMADYHEQLAKAGVLLDGAGLQPSSKGWRIRYDAKKPSERTVVDGPFAESKELIAGYTIIQVRTRAEALEWTRRYPNPRIDGKPAEIEVRQLFELEDFGPSEAVERFRDIGVGASAQVSNPPEL